MDVGVTKWPLADEPDNEPAETPLSLDGDAFVAFSAVVGVVLLDSDGVVSSDTDGVKLESSGD